MRRLHEANPVFSPISTQSCRARADAAFKGELALLSDKQAGLNEEVQSLSLSLASALANATSTDELHIKMKEVC